MKRRSRNTGSVHQRSPGRWRLRYDVPEPGGGRRQVSETVRGTRGEAERVLRGRLQAAESGTYVEKRTDTLAAFLGHWLETYVATNTAASTQRGYRGVMDRYVVPTLGAIPLQSLVPSHIQGIYADMLQSSLSAQTCLHAHRVLREALSHAVKWGLLARNPADSVDPPRPERKPVAMWDAATIQSFLAAAQFSRYRDIYELAVLTGMRRGELLGLKWPAVDLESRNLQVVSTLQRMNGRGLVEGPPKTSKSRRSIALSPAAVRLLRAVRTSQLEHRLAVGPAWSDTDYVFAQANGRPLHPDNVSNDFHSIVAASDLPHLTLHGLRHAHATLMLTAGVHPKIVSERLGHSNIAVTMDTYSHVLPGLQEAAAEAVDIQLSAARGVRWESGH